MLSQRLDVSTGMDTFQVYRSLRTVNPSPYMYFLRFTPDGPLGSSRKIESDQTHRARRIIAGLLVRVTTARLNIAPSPALARAGQRQTKTSASKKR